MREVKVRAWHKLFKEFVRPPRFLVIDADGMLCNDDVEIMQFTGLIDKNGVEIYEGDIVAGCWVDKSRYESGEYIYGVIEFIDSAFREVYRHSDKDIYTEAIDTRDGIVIGNIYQNPELVKP